MVLPTVGAVSKWFRLGFVYLVYLLFIRDLVLSFAGASGFIYVCNQSLMATYRVSEVLQKRFQAAFSKSIHKGTLKRDAEGTTTGKS